jgi:hypothetical protein
MEDVLEVLQRPHDPARPVVCLDETSKQLVKQTRVPIPAKPGRPARHDFEFERNSLPLRRRGVPPPVRAVRPARGWRHVEVTDRHAAAAGCSRICANAAYRCSGSRSARQAWQGWSRIRRCPVARDVRFGDHSIGNPVSELGRHRPGRICLMRARGGSLLAPQRLRGKPMALSP